MEITQEDCDSNMDLGSNLSETRIRDAKSRGNPFEEGRSEWGSPSEFDSRGNR